MSDLVLHKAAPECLRTEPHPEADCGLVQARRRRQQEMDLAARQQREAEKRRPRSPGTFEAEDG